MKLRNLFFIGAFLIFVAAMLLRHLPYFQQSISFLEVPLLEIEPSSIRTISIQKGNEELLLTQNAEQWLSTNGQWSNSIDPSRIQALLESIRTIKSTGIVAQKSVEWPLFNQTDPEVWFIRLYDRNQLVQAFFLSTAPKQDTSLAHGVYLRLPNTELVYEISALTTQAWLTPFSLYRDRQLLAFDPGAVRGIRVKSPYLGTIQLLHADSIWKDSTGQHWPDALVRPWLQQISNLEGQSYAERFNEVEKKDLPVTQYVFSIANQGNVVLEIFADSNQVQYPFVIRSNQFPGRYFKSDSLGLYQELKFFANGRFSTSF